MRSQYDHIKKLFRDFYLKNRNGIVTGREVFELVFAIEASRLLSKLEVDNEMAQYALRQAVSLNFTYEEFQRAIRRYRSKAG